MNKNNVSKRKINIALFFGGASAEHEVSLVSARNILNALNKQKYNPILVGINKKGQWFLVDGIKTKSDIPVFLAPAGGGELINSKTGKVEKKIELAFPALHGTGGEDGAIQGVFKLAGIPFVGCDVLGSAIGMDKDVSKRLLQVAGIKTARFKVFRANEKINFNKLKQELYLPLFIKPANLGSSIGINKVNNKTEFLVAKREAFAHENKIIIEENISGREIECAVLGNNNPRASVLGEVICHRDFYSYQAKYFDQAAADLVMPANLPRELALKIRELALRVYRVLECRGMARVDFFLTKDNQILVNEINTIPGFTDVSMYPKLWELSGLLPEKLIDELIELALEPV